MKKIALIPIMICGIILNITACINVNGNNGLFGKNIKGNGIHKEQERGRMDFNGIDVRGSIDVIIADIDDTPIKVSGDENLIDNIETYVKDGVLNIHFKNGFGYSSKTGLKVVIPNNGRINSIKASGSSNITSEGVINADNISIACKGSSNFNGNIKAEKCEIDCTGSSSIKGNIEATICKIKCTGSSGCDISGKADVCEASVSGSSSLGGYDFIVNKLTCSASGASGIQVTCKEELSAKASGASHINYKGSAKVVSERASGASNITKK